MANEANVTVSGWTIDGVEEWGEVHVNTSHDPCELKLSDGDYSLMIHTKQARALSSVLTQIADSQEE